MASSLIPTVVTLLRSARIDLSTEKRAQADVEQVLAGAAIVFEREVRLGEGDVIDFLIGGVGLELKLRGARKTEVYRQLRRYARHDRVDALILASTLSMGLPARVGGKDAYFVKLGEAWL